MGDHIVKSYEIELARLGDLISRMGGLAEAELASAMEAVTRRNAELVERIVGIDLQIDRAQQDIEHLAIRLLALRQPVGVDLRLIVAAPRIASELERIGDLSKNIGRRVAILSQAPPAPCMGGVERMGRLVAVQLHAVLDALASRNAEAARSVWLQDRDVDVMNASLFQQLLSNMTADPGIVTICTHLLFIAKNLERVGDHCTNIAEQVFYLILGDLIEGERPRVHAPA